MELIYSFLGGKYFILYGECLVFSIRYSSPSLNALKFMTIMQLFELKEKVATLFDTKTYLNMCFPSHSFLPFPLFIVLVKIMLMVYAPPQFKIFWLINHDRFINYCCWNSNWIHGYEWIPIRPMLRALHVANICIHVGFT